MGGILCKAKSQIVLPISCIPSNMCFGNACEQPLPMPILLLAVPGQMPKCTGWCQFRYYYYYYCYYCWLVCWIYCAILSSRCMFQSCLVFSISIFIVRSFTCASSLAFMVSIDSGAAWDAFAGSGIRLAFLNCSMTARGF